MAARLKTRAEFLLLIIFAVLNPIKSQYTPDWPSIDARPLPAWYDQAKIGIFIHWGVYSAPAKSNEWFGAEWFEWAYISGQNYPGDGGTPGDPPGPGSPALIEFMQNNYPPGTTYRDLAQDLTAESWNPDEWVTLFQNAGAKYVVLTSKHHEGFTLWPSAYSDPNWNSVDNGPHRDLVGDLAAATRRGGLRFGLYYSLCEWLHPLWLQDKRSGFSSNRFVEEVTMPKLYEVVNQYQPDVVWSDGEWSHDWYWNSTTFLAWLYNESPVKDSVVVNDRWGWDTTNTHGGFYSGQDRWNPGVLQPHKWENCFTLDRYSWGFRTDNRFEDYMRPEEIISTMVESVSCGGNVLINVAPTRNGSIPLIEQQLLGELGEWLGINGDAIYSSVPYEVQEDVTTDGVWYTSNALETVTYAIVTRLPTEDTPRIQLGSIPYAAGMTIQLLGNQGNLEYSCRIPCNDNPGITVVLPPQNQIRSKYAWTLVITR